MDVVTLGHDPPLAVGPDGVRPLRSSGGVPLGMGELACDVPEGDGPRIVRDGLAPGETLLLFTDGVTEARDQDGVFYPLQQDLARALAEDPGITRPDRLVRYIRDAVARHTAAPAGNPTTSPSWLSDPCRSSRSGRRFRRSRSLFPSPDRGIGGEA
ncbi:SpoIIE family protein phosphatase [Streptomyces albidoflavus]